MKACFVLQRRFAYVGHELAVYLKERGITDQFCAYVFLRDSYDFLKAQSDISYTSLALDEDIQKQYAHEPLDMEYIEKLEQDYGSVWDFISVDRVVRSGQLVREYPHDTSPYTYEEMLRIVQVYAKHILAFLDRERPDYIFSYQPGGVGSMLMHRIAAKRGIPVITVVFPVTRDRIVLSERYDRMTWVEEAVAKHRSIPLTEIPQYAEAKEFISEFRSKPSMYSKVYSSLIKHGKWKQFDFLLPRNIVRTITFNTYALFKNWFRGGERKTDYTTVHPIPNLADRMRRKLRNLRGVDDLYDEYDRTKPFVFYALHYEPEISVILLSPFDTDQITIIKRLARSVPAGMYVYVKEHPQMTPYRTRRYYKELKKIPNVRLLRPEVPSFDLIKQSMLVSTITGAAGWEATVLGKPVITFGEVFYNAVPSVARSMTPAELPALVARQINQTSSDEDLIRFVAALFADSASCDLLQVWEFETNQEKRRTALTDFGNLLAGKVIQVTS